LSREKLGALEKLQVVDLQIEELTKQADANPARLAELEKQVAEARTIADAERGRLADNERARRQIEISLEEEKDKVKKWESRLPQLKHPREFAALEREINSAKKANEANEEQLAQLQLDAEPLKLSVQQKEAVLASREAARAAEVADLTKNEKALREQAAALQASREEARATVDPKLVVRYEQVRKRRGGRVLVRLTSAGTCTGCNRKLLPQMAYTIMGGAIEQCPACQRILFYPPDPPSPQG
jgi:predicted  nucleic acid-binding Zn-ribbon protein